MEIVVAGEEVVVQGADTRKMEKRASTVVLVVEARGVMMVTRKVEAREEGLERGVAVDEGGQYMRTVLDEVTEGEQEKR